MRHDDPDTQEQNTKADPTGRKISWNRTTKQRLRGHTAEVLEMELLLNSAWRIGAVDRPVRTVTQAAIWSNTCKHHKSRMMFHRDAFSCSSFLCFRTSHLENDIQAKTPHQPGKERILANRPMRKYHPPDATEHYDVWKHCGLVSS